MSNASPARLSRTHIAWWVIISIAFGVLSVAPMLLFRIDPSSGFQGVEMQAADAEVHYAARVREIQDGFPTTANVFFSSPKQQPYLFAPAPEWIVAKIGGLIGLKAPGALAFSQFLFGAAVAAVMIGCFVALTGRFWWSLIGVTIWLFAGFLIPDLALLPRLITGTQGEASFLSFARPINPQWSAFLFFGALWALIQWIQTRSRWALVAMGIATALSVYSYVYVWTILGPVYAIVFLRYAFRSERDRMRDLALLGGGIILVCLPYFFNLWAAVHHPLYAETVQRFGMLTTRTAVFGITLVALLAIVGLWRYRWKETAWIVGAITVALLIAENQQLITGRAMVIAHYHWYFVKPITMILAIILAGSWIQTRIPAFIQRMRPMWLATPVLIGCVLAGALFQWRSYEYALPTWQTYQPAAGAIQWFAENAHAGDVTYAPHPFREFVAVYSASDVYWANNASLYLSSDEQARDAYFFTLWLKGVSAEEAAETLPTSRRAELSQWIHAIYYRETAGDFAAIPDQEVTDAIEGYRAYLAKTTEERLSRYPLTYIVFGVNDPATEAQEQLIARSERVYGDDAFEIWKLRD